MARKGRKRKSIVRRELDGRIHRGTAPERAESIMAVSCKAPHRRNVIEIGPRGRPRSADPRDPRLESELGRLCVRGEITAGQYAAGRRWAQVILRERRAIGAPCDSARGIMAAIMGDRGGGTEMSPSEAAAARADYADAWHALVVDLRPYDRRAVPEVLKMVIVGDHPCPDLERLRTGLDILARHFEACGGQARAIPRRQVTEFSATH